jgi:hypothetical protein
MPVGLPGPVAEDPAAEGEDADEHPPSRATPAMASPASKAAGPRRRLPLEREFTEVSGVILASPSPGHTMETVKRDYYSGS